MADQKQITASERVMDIQKRISEAEEGAGVAEQDNAAKYLTFRLEGQRFGIAILNISEIVRPLIITRLPNSPKFVLGVINLRGSIIPVLDIKMRFGLGEVQMSRNSRVIIVEINNKQIGLLVEEVSHVLSFQENQVEQARVDIAGMSVDFFRGYVTHAEDIILLLTLEKILE